MDRYIFGRDLLSLVVGDGEGDVCRALIELKKQGMGDVLRPTCTPTNCVCQGW